MNILLIRLSSMGDVVLASALLPALDAKYPGCAVTVLTDSLYAALFGDDPRVHSVIGLDLKRPIEAITMARQTRWDRIIDLQNSSRSRDLVSRIAPSAPVSRFKKLHLHRALLLTFRVNAYPAHRNVVARYLEAGGCLTPGESLPTPQLRVSPADAGTLRRLFGGLDISQPVLALVPFSAWRNKQWPGERFCAVGRHFRDKGWSVAVLGGPEDAARARSLVMEIGTGSVSLAGAASLHETCGILRQCSLALGNDTGLTHCARALGVRAGAVFGSTTHHFGFFPFGAPPFRVFEASVWCRPCHAHGGNFCYRISRPCLTGVTAPQVIAGLERLLGEPAEPPTSVQLGFRA